MTELVPHVREDNGYWDPTQDNERTFWPRILWVDPGGVTGVSCIWFHPGLLLDNAAPSLRSVLAWSGAYVYGPENTQVTRIVKIVKELGSDAGLHVGIEDFILRSAIKDRSMLSPVRITAKLDFVFSRGIREQDGEIRHRGYSLQSSSDAMTTITDSRLQLWDMYTPGPEHINDAVKHALLWLRKLRDGGHTMLARHHGHHPDWYA